MTTDNATTFVIHSRKADASRVCRRLQDHNVVAGIRGERGAWEIFGFAPDRLGVDGVRALAARLLTESRGG